MASRLYWEDLEVTTKCPICLETLEDPKTLPCFHSFCLMCLDNLAGEVTEHGKCVLKRNFDMEIVKEQKAIIDRCKDLLNSNETETFEFHFVNYAVGEEIWGIVQYGPGQLIVSNTDPSRCTVLFQRLTEFVVGREKRIFVRTRDSSSKQCYQKDDQVKMKIQDPWGGGGIRNCIRR